MAKVYAELIKKSVKTYTDVPDKLKEQVKEILIEIGCSDLVTE